MNDSERSSALERTLQEIERRWGHGAVMRPQEPAVPHPVVSTGVRALDIILGINGWPKGRIAEVYGPAACGKTTLVLHAIAAVQKAGGTAAFVDAEHALDINYAERLGVDVSKMLISQPDNGEQGLEIVETLVRSGAVDLVVVDSVANLVPRSELEGEMGDAHAGLQARLMSQALRKLAAVTSRNNAIVIFVNQLREKLGVTFGNGETTTGGNALKFYASVRVDMRKIGALREPGSSDDHGLIGDRTRIKVIKNKLAPPFQSCEVDLVYGYGFSAGRNLTVLAESLGVVAKCGNSFWIGDKKLGTSVTASGHRLDADAGTYELVSRAVDVALSKLRADTAEMRRREVEASWASK